MKKWRLRFSTFLLFTILISSLFLVKQGKTIEELNISYEKLNNKEKKLSVKFNNEKKIINDLEKKIRKLD